MSNTSNRQPLNGCLTVLVIQWHHGTVKPIHKHMWWDWKNRTIMWMCVCVCVFVLVMVLKMLTVAMWLQCFGFSDALIHCHINHIRATHAHIYMLFIRMVQFAFGLVWLTDWLAVSRSVYVNVNIYAHTLAHIYMHVLHTINISAIPHNKNHFISSILNVCLYRNLFIAYFFVLF